MDYDYLLIRVPSVKSVTRAVQPVAARGGDRKPTNAPVEAAFRRKSADTKSNTRKLQ